MSITEKKFLAITPKKLLQDGGSYGEVIIPDACQFSVGQIVILRSNSQPDSTFKVNRVKSESELLLGAIDKPVANRVDISSFLVSDNSEIFALEQGRPNIPPDDVWRAVYSEEPSISIRNLLVDRCGNDVTFKTYGSEKSISTSFADGGQKDSFDRLRISSVQTLLNAYHSARDHSLLFENLITGTASAVLNTDQAAMVLSVGTTSGDQIIRQHKRYIHYNPGRSYMISVSGNFGDPKSNVRKRWGLFDNNNGMFFQQTLSSFSVVLRSSVSGSPVDTIINQSNFSIDKVDGTGPSKLILDVNTHNLYIIDYVWQGAGRVRFGVIHSGKIVYFHEVLNDSNQTFPYVRTPSLPIRTELTNTGDTLSSTSVNLVCMSANKESIDETIPAYTFSANRGNSNKAVTAGSTAPVISIRPKLLFSSITNRIPIRPIEVPIISISNPLLVEVYLNPILTGSTFTSADPNSAVEYDISATSFTGGTRIKTFYVGGLSGQSAVTSFVTLTDILFLGLNISGNSADIITIVVTNLGSGSTQINAGVVWEEFE